MKRYTLEQKFKKEKEKGLSAGQKPAGGTSRHRQRYVVSVVS